MFQKDSNAYHRTLPQKIRFAKALSENYDAQIDYAQKTATIRHGQEVFHTSRIGCDCGDLILDGVSCCKHMYFLDYMIELHEKGDAT